MSSKFRVGINGFGRIGRLATRAWFSGDKDYNFEIVAVNNYSAQAETLAYLFKYDSTFRRFQGDVKAEGDNLIINGHKIAVLHGNTPEGTPWKDLGVDLVIESTGKIKEADKARGHIASGAKKVLITAPGKNEDATIVMGVNEETYDPAKHHIVSNASCTTNCLAPVCKVLHKVFGIEKGILNTVHSYTNDQMTLDKRHKKPERGRATAMSIIPTSTGAAKAMALVMPELKGKFGGFALRVPTPDVSVVDLTAILSREVTKEEINAAMEEAANSYLKGILGIAEDDTVSVDFCGDSNSAIFAPQHTYVLGNLVNVLAWYDNEWGYSCRVLDLAQYMFEKGL